MLVQRVQVKEVGNVDVAVAVAAGPVGAAVLVIQGHDLPTVKQLHQTGRHGGRRQVFLCFFSSLSVLPPLPNKEIC